MEALCERHCGNMLYVKFNVYLTTGSSYMYSGNHVNTNAKPITSPEYFINDSASFQVQIMYPNIFVKFVKLDSEDPLDYEIRVSCKQFLLENKTCNENDTWCLIHTKSELDYTFELKVYLEVLSSTNSFASLYTDTELLDFELHGEDGFVKVHKVVLAASSPYFKKMVSGNWREAKEGQVNFEGTSTTTLKHVKEYVYLHTLPDTGLEQLLLLASHIMMPDLEQRCVNKLVLNMTADKVSELLRFAVQHELTKLWLSILEAVQSRAVEVKDIRKHSLGNKHKLV